MKYSAIVIEIHRRIFALFIAVIFLKSKEFSEKSGFLKRVETRSVTLQSWQTQEPEETRMNNTLKGMTMAGLAAVFGDQWA